MSAITPQEFIAAQEKEEYPLIPEQLEALRVFLTDPTVPISQVAQDLTRPVIKLHEEAKKDPDALSNFDHGTLWSSIADAIGKLTDLNDRLVDLVVEIQKIPDPEGHFASMTDYKQHWNEFAYDFKVPRSDDPERDAKRQAWVNINAFCAKLSTRGVPVLDERQRAAWVFKETLERAPWEQFHHPDIDEMLEEDPDDEVVAEDCEYELECRDVRVLEYWVPAAAVWMQIDARGIYKMEGKISEGDEQGWYPTTWKGAPGWSKDRFSFWIERFEWISKVTALKRSTRKVAADAAESMKKVVEGN
ncbi:hypothetical protein QQS21_007068 [Conoideocrella luteorostrata]|uniref:Uncharacterized protein n=1 Tax=Conoideocrella luteorostrata TaxID=1105319 RepID=A0AAJ0FZS2_9HYPO|nr:hypothetical protein QQS21_007068 [Conoideocrella luteorostrata]